MPSATGAVLETMESDDAAAALLALASASPADPAPANSPPVDATPADEGWRDLLVEREPVDKGKDVAEL